MSKENWIEPSAWCNSVITILTHEDSSLISILEEAHQQILINHSIDYRVLLMCLLRDNMLPLQNRIIALLLLFCDDSISSPIKSRCLFILFDLFDSTESDVEKWICSHLILEDLMTLPIRSLSPQSIMNNISSIYKEYPINENIIHKIEQAKQEYYQTQILSQDLFPSLSFHSFYQLRPYPYKIPDLQSYLQSYLQDFDSFYQLLLFSSPSFERPTLSFQPSRDEFVFVPPPMSSETFLYTPINLSSHNQQLHKYHLSWQKPLEKEDYPEILNSPNVLKEFRDFALSPSSNEKTKKFTQFMEMNLELCHSLLSILLKEKNKKCCEKIMLDSGVSLYALDVGSFIALQNGVSTSCLLQYIKRYIKCFCEDPTMDVLVKCFCFFILGCSKKKLFDESEIHDDLIDLKGKYPTQQELSYTIHSLYGKTDTI